MYSGPSIAPVARYSACRGRLAQMGLASVAVCGAISAGWRYSAGIIG